MPDKRWRWFGRPPKKWRPPLSWFGGCDFFRDAFSRLSKSFVFQIIQRLAWLQRTKIPDNPKRLIRSVVVWYGNERFIPKLSRRTILQIAIWVSLGEERHHHISNSARGKKSPGTRSHFQRNVAQDCTWTDGLLKTRYGITPFHNLNTKFSWQYSIKMIFHFNLVGPLCPKINSECLECTRVHFFFVIGKPYKVSVLAWG